MLKQTCAKVLMGAVLFAAPAFAGQDFLADVTQGAFQDTMHGVQPLTDSEKEQVLGGYNVGFAEIRNTSIAGTSLVEIGVGAMLTRYELENGVSCGINSSNCYAGSYVNRQRFNELVSLVNPARGEVLVFTATKTVRPSYGMFGGSIPTFTYGPAVYNANMGWITRRVTSNSQVGSELMLRYKNELNRILVTQYR